MNKNKFHLICCCVICQQLITVQSLKEHIKHRHVEAPKCLQCNKTIKKTKKFCNSSCSAKYNNTRRIKVYTPTARKNLEKSGHNSSLVRLNKQQSLIIKKYYYQNPKYCTCCNTLLPYKKRNYSTCGRKKCIRKIISLKVRGKTGGSRHQYINYIDSYGNNCSLDSTWELKIANELDKNNIKWIRPPSFILKNNRRYTPDFFLPEYNVFLDPKAKRKRWDWLIISLEKIEMFQNEYDVKCIVITEEENLTWNYIQQELIGAGYESRTRD